MNVCCPHDFASSILQRGVRGDLPEAAAPKSPHPPFTKGGKDRKHTGFTRLAAPVAARMLPLRCDWQCRSW